MRTWMLPAALVGVVVIAAVVGTGAAGGVVLIALLLCVLVGGAVVYSSQTGGRSEVDRDMPVGRLDELLKRHSSGRRGR